MAIEVGDALPHGQLTQLDAAGLATVAVPGDLGAGKTLMIAMPGAFTRTCSVHLPAIVADADAIRATGIERIIVFVVNDLQVVQAWADQSGAPAAGIEVLGDVDGSFTKALGRTFDVPTVGFFGRAMRFALVVAGGRVTALQAEEGRGTCDMTSGTALLGFLER